MNEIPPRIYDYLLRLTNGMRKVRRQRVAALITDSRNNVVGVGTCQMKTHPLQARFGAKKDKIYLHAEIDAIASALSTRRALGMNTNLSDYKLFILRVKASGKIGLAKPCEVCQGAIDRFGISEVHYTTE